MKKVIIFGLAVLLAACEKPIMEDDIKSGHESDANVVLRITACDQEAATRSAETLTDQCSRLSVAVFDEDDAKVGSTKNQKAGDSGFGTVSLSLQEGVYTIVAIAHNGEGNATITSPTKVTFPSNKMTDTFCYCGELEVTGDMISQELQMQRVVAMMRLTLTDEQIPAGVARLKFYYTGGSSTLNPRTGYGCVNSKQTEYRATVAGGSAVKVYEIYTAPHEQSDVLKLTITAQDAGNEDIRVFDAMENIPVTRNKITTWEGSLFGSSGTGGGATSEGGVSLTLDTQWDGTISYTW
jgi:DNA-directed RNA polymerase subunit L